MTKFDFNELLDKKPDLAIVTATNAGKTEVCLKILSRGIPVIVEKPMAVSYEDAKNLLTVQKNIIRKLSLTGRFRGFLLTGSPQSLQKAVRLEKSDELFTEVLQLGVLFPIHLTAKTRLKTF